MRVEAYGYMKDLQWTLPAPTVDNITSTSAIVRWMNTTGSPLQANITFYIIKYQDDSTTRTLNVSGFETIVNITDLTPYTNYSVWIKAVDIAGHGSWSCSTNFTTLFAARPYGVPVSVTAYSLSSQSLHVTWLTSKCGSNGPIRGYKIMCTAISMNLTKKYATSANQTSYNITSLEKWTEYRITVKCFNDNGEGPASAEVIVRTMEDAPGEPEHFKATVLSSTCIQLDWALPSEANGIIRGFKMRYKKLTKGNVFSSNTTFPGNATLSYVLTGLEKCTPYSFKILAYTIRDGPYTHEIQRTTAEENVCQDNAVGIADRNIIPDDKFTATSWYGGSNEPWDARLNGADYGWAPRTPSDPNDYLQIDLGQVYVLCAIATQGCNGCSERTTQYKISTSVDKNTGVWATSKNGVIDKLFPGNTDSNTVVKNVLVVPVLVRYIRFIPTAYYSWKTMRVEAYGYMKDLQWTSPAPTVHNITSTSAIVRWRNTTGSPLQANITFYIIKYQDNSTTRTLNVSGFETSVNITGLTPYTNYSVWIKAVDIAGHGSWSCSTNFTTLFEARPYGVPVSVTAYSLSSQSLRVTWLASKCRSSGPIRGYKIMCAAISMNLTKVYSTSADQTSYNITSLEKWTEYRITVKCFNDNGEGPASAEVIVRTMEDAPGQPQSLRVTVLNSTDVRLDWTLPSETNGIIRGFKLRYEKTGSSSEKDLPGNTTLSYVLTGLDKCTLYFFQMLAYTIKDGPYTSMIQKTTAEEAPSAPVILKASIISPNGPSVPQVTLTWSKPEVCGDNVLHYKVTYNHDADPTSKVETVDKSQLAVTIPVWGGVTYEFRVRGVTNKEGPDTPKKTVVIPIYAPSVSPSNLTFSEANKTTFKVSWVEIPRSKSNGPVVAYEVNQTLVRRRQKARRSIDAAVKVKLVNSLCCSLHLYDLLVCAEYHISIKGYTSVGEGPSSNVKSLETSVPGPPVNLMVQATKKREVSLTWQKPESVTEAIESYTISFEGQKDYNGSFVHSDSLSVSSTKIEVPNLYPGTRYTFQVSATTACGKGDYGLSSSINTKVDAPPAPVVGFVDNITSEVNNITVWESSDINGPIKAYQIIVVQVDKTSSIDETKLKSYEEAEKEELHYYIAAEIRTNNGNKFPRIFILGDEKEYNAYQNVKIKDGIKYHVLQRALTQNEKKEYLAGRSTLIAEGKIPDKKDSLSGQHTPTTDKTCSDLSDSVAVSLAFNAVFLVFIVLLLVYIKKLRKELEETKKALAENRPATAYTQAVYESINTIDAEEGLAMAPIPAIAVSTYEQIDLRGAVDPSDVQTKVTGPQTIPADKSVGYYEPIKKPINELKNQFKPKPKPKPKQQIYETVQPKSHAPNPKQLQNTTSSSSQSTYQSLTQENRHKPVYQSLHTYGNTKINNDGSEPRTQYLNQSQA